MPGEKPGLFGQQPRCEVCGESGPGVLYDRELRRWLCGWDWDRLKPLPIATPPNRVRGFGRDWE